MNTVLEVCFLKDKSNSCPITKTSIGGQALIEGVMMRGPKKTAMTVRNPEGELVVEEWENEVSKRAKFFRLPFVRGVFNFVDSMKFGYKCLMRSAEIAGLEDEEEKPKKVASDAEVTETEGGDEKSADEKSEKKEEKGTSATMGVLMVISVVLAVVFAVGLFIVLPTFLSKLLANHMAAFDNQFVRSAFEGLLRVVILVGYLAAVSLMKDIRRTYQYHGAEHKTIFCYESGLELTVENVRKQRRFHPRCGTSFLILIVLVGILVSMLIPTTIGDWEMPVYLRSIIKLALLPVVMGVGYELIKLAGKHDNVFTRIISAPGVWLQHLTVLEPDDDMIECAIESMKRVIPEDGSDRW